MAPYVIRSVLDHVTRTIQTAAPLLIRDDDNKKAHNTPDPTKGEIPPTHINNNALFALFGIIGAAFVVVGIWFFFWAKNGGFYFKENDWDDYKTTVMRRRGPNGTLLTGATPSTQLGGGSVYKDYDDHSTEDGRTVVTGVTESTEMTGITGGVSDFSGREKRRQKREQKERDKERRREERAAAKKGRHNHNKNNNKSSRHVNPEGVLVDEEAEAEAKAHLRNYRHEKPARVGGINKESEGSNWDGSTNPSASSAGGGSEVTSELMSNRQHTPTSTPTKSGGGIRKVYSAAERTAEKENERIRAEARRLREKGRAATAAAAASSSGSPRRDFSFQRGAADDSTYAGHNLRRIDERSEVSAATSSPSRAGRESRVSGQSSDVGTDLGTKTYSHHIPGLSSTGSASAAPTEQKDFAYQDEKRRRRGGAGYRRDRGGDDV